MMDHIGDVLSGGRKKNTFLVQINAACTYALGTLIYDYKYSVLGRTQTMHHKVCTSHNKF